MGEKNGFLISWKIIVGLCLSVSAFSDRSKQVEDNENIPLGLNKWWLRPLSRGDCLTEVKITVIKGKQIWDFDNGPLNTGRPLITVLLNTGSTVLCRRRLISSPFPPENHVILPIILHPYSLPHRRLKLTSSCSENEFKNNVETQNIRVKKSDALQH